MTIKIPANATKLDLDRAIKQFDTSKKSFEASKYIGKIKFSGDPVEFQQALR